MKKFTDYLTESKKTYSFKVGVAGEIPEGFEEKMKMGLEKYNASNISAGKRTPISKRPLDFPQLENMEVTYYEFDLHYPTTTQVLQDYLENLCSVPKSHIIVRTPGEPQEEYQAEEDTTPYESMLNTEDMGGTSAQESVAGNRVMDLLKELETARKEREIDPMEGAPAGESADIDNSENTKAVVGG